MRIRIGRIYFNFVHREIYYSRMWSGRRDIDARFSWKHLREVKKQKSRRIVICSLHGRQRKKKTVDMKGALLYAKKQI